MPFCLAASPDADGEAERKQAPEAPRRHSSRERTSREVVSIDLTDRNEVLANIRHVFRDGADRDRAAAIRDVAHSLGFRRTGSRIDETLDNDLMTAVRRGILQNDRGKLSLLCRSVEDYRLDHLVDMLLAAMGQAWQTRDEAITAAARHLGFRRTGPSIRDAFKSAINAAQRRGLIERDGPTMIRKSRGD